MFDDLGRSLADMLAGQEPSRLRDDELIELICAWGRLVAWAQAGQFAALAEFARRRRGPGDDGMTRDGAGVSEFAVDEVAAALRLSRAAAGGRLHVAVQLSRQLPATAAALSRGELDLPKVRTVVEATAALCGAAVAAVEARVLPRAGRQTVGQLRASLSRAVLAVDPASAEARHQRATLARRVVMTAQPDGMAELWALLPADAATAVYGALDAHARSVPAGDGRGIDARRADALVALATGAATAQTRPLVQVTVAASTLLGDDDAPGELAGHGPIPASMARRIAADTTGTWRRILTDPATGAVLDVGRTSYRPPAALGRHVFARDGTCRFPGCRQPARRCDLDHVRPWPAGPTAAANLIALCRHHHRLKHTGRWQVAATDSSVVTWTAPTGHAYTTHPARAAIPGWPAVARNDHQSVFRPAGYEQDTRSSAALAARSVGLTTTRSAPQPGVVGSRPLQAAHRVRLAIGVRRGRGRRSATAVHRERALAGGRR